MFKKLFPVLIASLLLVGCGDKTTSISNQSQALIKIGSQTVTNGEVYQALIAQDATETVKSMATQLILNKEVEITDEMKAKADTELADFKANVGDNVDLYLKYYGYKDLDDYYTNGILPTLQQEVLVNKYLNENYDSLAAEHLPKKIRLIEVTDATKAAEALAEIKAGKDFGEIASAYSTTSYPGDEELVYASSDLPQVVLAWLNVQTTPTLSEIIPDTTASTNYIVQVTVADANKLKDEAIAFFAADTTFMETALKAYYKSNNFKIYDKTVYDAFTVTYADYIAQ